MVMNVFLFASSNNDNKNNSIIAKEDFMKNYCYDLFEISALTKSHGTNRLQDSRVETTIIFVS